MLTTIFRIILIVFTLYCVLPFLLTRIFNFFVVKQKPKGKNEITLTFDDGPDPIYTPLLLDLLKKYKIKATFFIVGSKAKKHPDIINRMYNEGHLIGIHNYNHTFNWFNSPLRAKNEIDKTAKLIKEITGETPKYYRPPWGILNLYHLIFPSKYKIILWSVMVGDWKLKGGRQRIKSELQTKIKNGSIIVLHDSGETFGADQDAPGQMIQALENLLNENVLKDFEFVRLDYFLQK